MSAQGPNLFRSVKSHCAIRNALPCSAVQLRTFTCSLAQLNIRHVPVFKPTSSPELDEQLKTVRQKMIVPLYLSRQQRNLIYKQKYKKALELEPAVAKIGDEELRLEHIGRPFIPHKKNIIKALDLMKDRTDYENVIGLLEGISKGRSSRGNLIVYRPIARRLGEAGRQDVLLELVRQAFRTGFTLVDFNRTTDIMEAMSRKAYDSSWDATQTNKALRWSEQLLDLMEDPRHRPKYGRGPDPRKRPDIIGRVLELAAVKASKHQGGKDVDGKVEQLAKRVLHCLPKLPPTPANFEGEDNMKANIGTLHNRWLAAAVPLLHGMKVAQQVMDSASEVGIQLGEEASKLERDVNSSYEILSNSKWGKEKSRKGLVAYEKAFGSES